MHPEHPHPRRGGIVHGLLLALGAGWLNPSGAGACGPYFPPSILHESDAATAALDQPFIAGILDLPGLPRSVFPYRASYTPATSAGDADAAALRRALETAGRVDPELEQQLAAARGTINTFRTALADWRERSAWGEDAGPRPVLGEVAVPARLPAELRLYLEGAVAYHHGDLDAATAAWRRVLELPEAARRERSVMATFMLGRAVLDAAGEPPLGAEIAETAARRFHAVRALARAGFRDDLALAHESLGWEARAEWQRGRFAAALALYAEQLAAGDHHAQDSLHEVCHLLAHGDRQMLGGVAEDPLAREIFTLYLAGHDHAAGSELWLELMRERAVEGLSGGALLAWLAYQHGRFEDAGRWLELADDGDGRTLWIRAKLLARAGDLAAAKPLLEAAASQLAQRPFRQPWHPMESEVWPTAARALGEAGALEIGQGHYPQALDTLARSGYWQDAAYVAERVMSSAELTAFVEAGWPRELVDQSSWDAVWDQGTLPPRGWVARGLRHLLARRLAREGRWPAAAPYYPTPELRAKAEQIAGWHECAENAACPRERRADALWQMAVHLRRQGLELIATELDPDWNAEGAHFDLGAVSRPAAPPEETERVESSRAQPYLRYHYRYLAAELAWRAAELLPDDDEQTAEVLATAGSWLKNLDPARADRFYKALVRRCGQTALGREADRLRWFPPLPTALEPRSPK